MMKEGRTTEISLLKNKWDEKKNYANIYINPKLCFLNYRSSWNTSKIPLAIIHLSCFLATFQAQSPQRLQCNLLTSWVRTKWLFSIRRIQNLILQHLSWKKKIHIKKYIPHEILILAYTNIQTAAGGPKNSSSKKRKGLPHFYSLGMKYSSLEAAYIDGSWEILCQTTFRKYSFSVVSLFSSCFTYTYLHIHGYVCMCVCIYIYICVCVFLSCVSLLVSLFLSLIKTWAEFPQTQEPVCCWVQLRDRRNHQILTPALW